MGRGQSINDCFQKMNQSFGYSVVNNLAFCTTTTIYCASSKKLPTHTSFCWVSLKPLINRALTTEHLPTDQPTTDQPTTDQMHWPPTNRLPASKKLKDQKKFEFMFDINYDFKYRVLEIILYIMHTHYCLRNIVVCLCVFFN